MVCLSDLYCLTFTSWMILRSPSPDLLPTLYSRVNISIHAILPSVSILPLDPLFWSSHLNNGISIREYSSFLARKYLSPKDVLPRGPASWMHATLLQKSTNYSVNPEDLVGSFYLKTFLLQAYEGVKLLFFVPPGNIPCTNTRISFPCF